jgi:hypothetical protein
MTLKINWPGSPDTRITVEALARLKGSHVPLTTQPDHRQVGTAEVVDTLRDCGLGAPGRFSRAGRHPLR